MPELITTTKSESSVIVDKDFILEKCPHEHTFIYHCLVDNYESEILLEINGKEITTKVNKYPEFKKAKITGSYNTGTKQDFGDIDLMPHREWEEKVCAAANIEAILPLWNGDRLSLVNEFLNHGFKARVTCVDGRFLDESFVGNEFDAQFLAKLPKGVDACGENGEFHTFVYDGPNFSKPVKWKSLGKQKYVSPPEYGQVSYYFDLLDTA